MIARRKLEHLDLCATGDVEARGGTLLDDVHLIHEALPELSVAEIDPSVELFGRRLAAPIYVSGMTGGTERAGTINRALAVAAQKSGIGLGVGSQRILWSDRQGLESFRVRDVAPGILLFGNVGVVQARDAGVHAVADLAGAIGADAMCIHLNAAQELVQDEGDRDFRGGLDAIAELVESLPVPVLVKETGCGLSPRTLERLAAAGVRHVDVAGAGGTTWTGVEALRGSARQQALGRTLREWGIPTAPSVVFARRAGLVPLASGGIRDALDVVRALALGARAVGLALPFLRGHEAGSAAAVQSLAEELARGVRSLLLLVGARSVDALVELPIVLGPTLRGWLAPFADRRARIGQGLGLVDDGDR